jgi:hypothetical protein
MTRCSATTVSPVPGRPSITSTSGPFGSLPTHSDPFGEPGDICAGLDQQRGLSGLAWPLAVSLVAVAEAEDQPGLFGEQVAPAGSDLPQLGDRRDVDMVATRVSGSRTGETGGDDLVRPV